MHIIFVISRVNVSLLSFALSEVVQGNYIFELDIRNNIFFQRVLANHGRNSFEVLLISTPYMKAAEPKEEFLRNNLQKGCDL